ncbi:unnamed protein product, partial [Polarella glacialis]
ENCLCFDDPLSVSAVHLCCVPAQEYIPDLRYLFGRPKRGRRMLELLYNSAAKACLENYWGDESFQEFYLGGKTKWKKLPTESELLVLTAAGNWAAPSPAVSLRIFLRFQGFFPYSFLLASLKALEDDDRDFRNCHPDYDMDLIIDEMEKFYGISYDKHWHAMISQIKQMQETYAPWAEKDFEYRVVGNQVFDAQTGFHHPEIT